MELKIDKTNAIWRQVLEGYKLDLQETLDEVQRIELIKETGFKENLQENLLARLADGYWCENQDISDGALIDFYESL